METRTQEIADRLARAQDWRERRACALRLGRIGDREAFDPLARALGDRDPEVRHAVVQALTEIGDTRAIPLVSRPRIIEDPCTNVRWSAVRLIGLLGSLDLVEVLRKALQDREWVVRNQAHLAVANFLRALPQELREEELRTLVRLLAIPDEEVAGLIIEALARRSTRALPLMTGAMGSTSAVIRTRMTRALGLSQDPRAVPALLEAGLDEVREVRLETARALGRIQDRRALDLLVKLLGDADRRVCLAAVAALVRLDKEAVPHLLAALDHSPLKRQQRYIVQALGEIGDRLALVPLLNMLRSSYHVIRVTAIKALTRFGRAALPDLIEMVPVNDVPLQPLIQEAENQGNLRLRVRAMDALGDLKNSEAVPSLRRLLASSNPLLKERAQQALDKIECTAWGRQGVAVALGGIGDIKAVPTLIRALRDPVEYVREEAARALAKLGHDTAVQPLLVALETDEDPQVRREAARALWQIGAQSEETSRALRISLTDPDWQVRAEAARALGRIDDHKSVEALCRSLADPSFTVVASARIALGNLGTMALPFLLEKAAGADSPERTEVLQVLAVGLGEEGAHLVEELAECPPAGRREVVARIREHLRP